MPEDQVATDRFGRRAPVGPTGDGADVVGFYTPEGRQLWARLQGGPPMTAVTSEQFAAILAADGDGGRPVPSAADSVPKLAVPPGGQSPADADADAGSDAAGSDAAGSDAAGSDADTGSGSGSGSGESTSRASDRADAAPAGPHPWLPGAGDAGRKLAAWRLSGRGSLDAPTDD